jgi:hypothetical protein
MLLPPTPPALVADKMVELMPLVVSSAQEPTAIDEANALNALEPVAAPHAGELTLPPVVLTSGGGQGTAART